MPLKKPWRVITNHAPLRDYLFKKCRGGHLHDHCSGKVAQESGRYCKGVVEAAVRGLLSSTSHLTLPTEVEDGQEPAQAEDVLSQMPALEKAHLQRAIAK